MVELSLDRRSLGISSRASQSVLFLDTRCEAEPVQIAVDDGPKLAFGAGKLWVASASRLRSFVPGRGDPLDDLAIEGEGTLVRVGDDGAVLWTGDSPYVVSADGTVSPIAVPQGARVADLLAPAASGFVATVGSDVLLLDRDGAVRQRISLASSESILEARSVDGGILVVSENEDGEYAVALLGLAGQRAFTLRTPKPARIRLAPRRRFLLVLGIDGDLCAIDLRYGRRVASVAADDGISDFDVDTNASLLAVERTPPDAEPQVSLFEFRELFGPEGAQRLADTFSSPAAVVASASKTVSSVSAPGAKQKAAPGPTVDKADASAAVSPLSATPMALDSPRRSRRLPARQRIDGAPPDEVSSAYLYFLIERVRALLRFRIVERGVGQLDPAKVQQDFEVAFQHEEAMRSTHPFPFDQLCQAIGLDPLDRDALVLAAAPHFDPSVRDEIRRLRQDATRSHVDGALVLDLFASTRVEGVAESHRFDADWLPVDAGLVELVPTPLGHIASLAEHEIVPTPKLLELFRSQLALAPRIADLAELRACDPDEWIGVVSNEERRRMFDLCRTAFQSERRCLALLVGPAGTGRERIARAIAADTGHERALSADFTRLPDKPHDLAKALGDLGREAGMLGAALVVRDVPVDLAADRMAALRAALDRLSALIVVTSTGLGELRRAASLVFELGRADSRVRERGWKRSLIAAGVILAEDQVVRLAHQYPLSPSRIERTIALGVTQARIQGEPPCLRHFEFCAESQIESELSQYADRSASNARLDDLVLSDETRADIEEVIHAFRARPSVMRDWGFGDKLTRGRGICALFNGPPGTGKTFAAGVIANELELPMFRINVSSIVDRYVGETEKNLAALFKEAADHRALLLFDEADSLFAKRVQAKDATDRYTNMQTNLLLNLVEDYEGLVILTTNMKSGIDTAFLRRVAFKVTFSAPEEAERLALWKKHLPGSAPLAEDVDLSELARDYERVAGGDIKNAVLRAAFRAWPDSAITQSLLREALAAEVRASGGVISDRPRKRSDDIAS